MYIHICIYMHIDVWVHIYGQKCPQGLGEVPYFRKNSGLQIPNGSRCHLHTCTCPGPLHPSPLTPSPSHSMALPAKKNTWSFFFHYKCKT